MIGADEARALAMALPDAVERDHHGFPSFRVRDKIFATLPDAETLRIMLAADDAQGAASADPHWCSVLLWGARISGVAVHLPGADPATVTDLLADAWRRRAPAVLVRAFDAAQAG